MCVVDQHASGLNGVESRDIGQDVGNNEADKEVVREDDDVPSTEPRGTPLLSANKAKPKPKPSLEARNLSTRSRNPSAKLIAIAENAPPANKTATTRTPAARRAPRVSKTKKAGAQLEGKLKRKAVQCKSPPHGSQIHDF